MADLFISYARSDRNRIEQPTQALPAQSYSIWLDWRLVDYLAGMMLRRLRRPDEARTMLDSALGHLLSKLVQRPMVLLMQTPSSYDGIRFTHYPDFAPLRDDARFWQILGRDG